MATVIPTRAEIESLPPPLTVGESELLAALELTLDDRWTIYVQPHLNGLRPDFVIFSPHSGIGIIEVKDWDLSRTTVQIKESNARWIILDGMGQPQEVKDTPLAQVERYYRTLITYQLAPLCRIALDNSAVFGVIRRYIFFSRYSTKALREKIPSQARSHVTIFGRDVLDPKMLRSVLQQGGLPEHSRFAYLFADKAIENILKSVLGYPEHGKHDQRFLKLSQLKLTSKQQELLPNEAGRKRRVVGAAGAGKSVVAAIKAAQAASEGKNVFVTCFNITMANYLRDATNCLARDIGPHVQRNIEVSHFHAAFNLSAGEDRRNNSRPIDVLLIDEGQDFEREWIELMYRSCSVDAHLMFFEDARQNIYSIDSRARLTLPGIVGRPNILSTSYRIPHPIALLANHIASFANREDDVVLEAAQQGLFDETPLWHEAENIAVAAESLVDHVISSFEADNGPAPADVAILVCSEEAGRTVIDALQKRSQPYVATFPDRPTWDRFQKMKRSKRDVDTLLRSFKVEFWMQTGRTKVSSIHSFKGWELSNIYVLFAPLPEQRSVELELLYTAVTRSQGRVRIFATQHHLGQLRNGLVLNNIVRLLELGS